MMAGAAAVFSGVTGAAIAGNAVASNSDSEFLAACREWWNEEAVLKTQCDAAITDEEDAIVEERASLHTDRCFEICQMPARTIAGLFEKVRILQKEGRVFPSNDFAVSQPDETSAIMADIEALAMGDHHNG